MSSIALRLCSSARRPKSRSSRGRAVALDLQVLHERRTGSTGSWRCRRTGSRRRAARGRTPPRREGLARARVGSAAVRIILTLLPTWLATMVSSMSLITPKRALRRNQDSPRRAPRPVGPSTPARLLARLRDRAGRAAIEPEVALAVGDASVSRPKKRAAARPAPRRIQALPAHEVAPAAVGVHGRREALVLEHRPHEEALARAVPEVRHDDDYRGASQSRRTSRQQP